jgi:hypothetical protein
MRWLADGDEFIYYYFGHQIVDTAAGHFPRTNIACLLAAVISATPTGARKVTWRILVDFTSPPRERSLP